MKLVFILIFSLVLGGCSTVGYYMEAINGHFAIMDKSRPIEEIINENKATDLSVKLQNFQKARKFATEQLLLPDNDSYKEYADIGREYAVWNVIAAPKLSVEPKKWCFLFVGCISYRGYFNKRDAEAYAEQLQNNGYDVYVTGARAYSTLGWFDDPLLNTMMYKSEAARVGILFHELAHQKLYIEDDSAFNEAFATAIEQEGVERWFINRKDFVKLSDYKKVTQRRKEFYSLLKKYRNKLKVLYSGSGKNQVKLNEKEKIFKKLKTEYSHLKTRWQGYDGYDERIGQSLNNAHLAIIATYNELVPFFREKITETENLEHFYKYIKVLSENSISDRKKTLNY